MMRLLGYSIPAGSNPVDHLYAIENLYSRARNKGLTADTPFILAHFLSLLPPEYHQAKFALETKPSVSRGEIIRMVATVHASITKKPERRADQAFFAAAGNGAASNGAASNGGLRGGRGNNGRRKGNQDGANENDRDDMRCFRCSHKGHTKRECKTAEADFNPKCTRCGGFGHTKNRCPTGGHFANFSMVVETGAEEEKSSNVEAEVF
ncbi:unnamed protein product [Pylaiella littoralis]